MAYVPICWPEIQHYMDLPGFDENAYLINDDHGIDDFGSSAYFVDEDWLNDLEEGEDKDGFVSNLVSRCLHVYDDGEEYEFDEPVGLSGNRVARKFWVDDGNEDIRVEVWQIAPTEAWREDDFLSTMENVDDAYEIAKRIDNDEFHCKEDEEPEYPWDYGKHFD